MGSIDEFYEKNSRFSKGVLDTYVGIVNAVRRWRDAEGIAQKEVAEKCGMSYANVSAMERFALAPNALAFISYLKLAGVDFQSLINGSGKNEKITIDPEKDLPKTEIISFLVCLPEECQERIFEEIKKVKNINAELIEVLSTMSKEKQEALLNLLKS